MSGPIAERTILNSSSVTLLAGIRIGRDAGSWKVGLGLCAFVALFRWSCDRLDRARIRSYVRERVGEVLGISWTPFGEGWFGAGTERIYSVRFRMGTKPPVCSTCKTSWLTGVYWSHGPAPDGEREIDARSCLRCGLPMTRERSTCRHCGWSYANRTLDGERAG